MTPWLQEIQSLMILITIGPQADIKHIRILNEMKNDNLKNEITLILTEWDEFVKLNYSKTKLFDGRYII